MRCQNCGFMIHCYDRFCQKCGSRLPVQQNLIFAAMQNDQAAYTELYHQAERPVRMTVYSIISPDGGNNADADDIIVDTMVKGFRSLSQLSNPDSFVAWMRTIARNKSIDYLRKYREMTFSELSNDEDGEFEDTLASTDISGSPELSMDQKAKAAILREILSSLPSDQRAVLVMYYYHQMKISEIAGELGISEATVKSRLKYSKAKVEACVNDIQKKQGIKLYSITPVLLLVLFGGAENSLGTSSYLQNQAVNAALYYGSQAAYHQGTAGPNYSGQKTGNQPSGAQNANHNYYDNGNQAGSGSASGEVAGQNNSPYANNQYHNYNSPASAGAGNASAATGNASSAAANASGSAGLSAGESAGKTAAGTKAGLTAGGAVKAGASIGTKAGIAAVKTKMLIGIAAVVIGGGAVGTTAYVVSTGQAAKSAETAVESESLQTAEAEAPKEETASGSAESISATDSSSVTATQSESQTTSESAVAESEAASSAQEDTHGHKTLIHTVSDYTYNGDGDSFTYEETCNYDQYGNVTLKAVQYSDGRLESTTYDYEYDADGNILSTTETDSRGNTYLYSYVLRSDGLWDSMTYTNEYNGYNVVYSYTLRDDGQPAQSVETKTYNWGGIVTMTRDYTYDDSGNLIAEHGEGAVQGAEVEIQSEDYTYTLDENKDPETCNFYIVYNNGSGSGTITYTYGSADASASAN